MRLPTRHAHGIVYSPEHSAFMYHTWAETWVDGVWYRLDPALRQLRADATHVKLETGDAQPSVTGFANTIGRLQLQVLSFETSTVQQ